MKHVLLLFLVVIGINATNIYAQGKKTNSADSILNSEKNVIGAYFSEGQFEEVLKRTEKLLVQYPKDTVLIVQRSISLLTTNKSADGVSLLQTLIKHKDSAAKQLMSFSFMLNLPDSGKYLYTCANEAIKLSPNSHYGYFSKAVYNFETKNYNEALGLFQKCVDAKNNSMRDKKVMNSFVARTLHELNKKEEAYKLMDFIGASGAEESEVLDNYGTMLRTDGRFTEALPVFERLSRKNPNDEQAKLAVIGAMNFSGKNKEACEMLDTLVKKDAAFEFLRYELRCKDYFFIPRFTNAKKYTFQCFVSETPFDLVISNPVKNEDGSISFSWANEEQKKSGNTKLLESSLNSKNIIDTFVKIMPNGNLNSGLTFWLNKNFYDDIKRNKSITLTVDSKQEKFEPVTDNMYQPDYNRFESKIPVNGELKYIECMHLVCKENGHEIWVNFVKDNPMILKMYFGKWAVELVSID